MSLNAGTEGETESWVSDDRPETPSPAPRAQAPAKARRGRGGVLAVIVLLGLAGAGWYERAPLLDILGYGEKSDAADKGDDKAAEKGADKGADKGDPDTVTLDEAGASASASPSGRRRPGGSSCRSACRGRWPSTSAG